MLDLNRRTFLAGALSAAAVSMAGCGSDSAGDTAAPKADASVPTSGTLDAWCWDPAFNVYAMKEAGKIYAAKHPDVKMNAIETPWDDIQTKITTLAQSQKGDQLPDIFLVQNNAFQKNVINYPDLFADLTDSGLAYDQFGESVVNYSTVDGKRYGVPFDNGCAITGLRTDLLGQAGLKIDDFTDITWDDYIAKGKQVKAKTGKPILSGQSGQPDIVMMMLQSAGASLFTDDDKVNIVDNEPLTKALEVYKQLLTSGVMTENNSWDQYVGSFVNSNVAGVMNGMWILGSVQTAKAQAGKWAITNLPKLDGVEGATNYSANGGSSWAVSAQGNTALAVDFLKETFAGSKELYETILPSSGALANWTPAAETEVYKKPVAFFNDEAIYSKIVEYSKSVPSNRTGVFYYEARDALGAAMTKVIKGTDIKTALAEAQKAVEFAMK